MPSQTDMLIGLILVALLYVLVTCVLAVLSHLHASEVDRHDLILRARSRRLEYGRDRSRRRDAESS